MTIGSAGFPRSTWRGVRWFALVSMLTLGACHPVDTWRDLTGASKDDPNPQTTPNTKNLAAGEAAGYPNLATVPEPPTQALTTAERDKLTQSLIADRANAKYTDEKLRAGFSVASAAPPPPPPPLPPSASTKEKVAGDGTAPAAGAEKSGAVPTGPAGKMATAGSAPGSRGVRKAGEPPEPGPKESSLQSPQIAAPPEPEAPQPAPPPPALLKKSAGGQARLPGAPAPAPMPAGLAAAGPQPAPPPPSLPPPAPPEPHTAALSGTKSTRPAPVATAVGEIGFTGNSASLTEADKPILDKIVQRYRQQPAKIRIVGYAGATSIDADQLASFHAALGRAQAVAAALQKAGIPANRILVEAAPAGADTTQGRAEVLFEH